MPSSETVWPTILSLIVALLYVAVGQAGASSDLATLGPFRLAPMARKTTALSLSLLIAGIGTIQFF